MRLIPKLLSGLLLIWAQEAGAASVHFVLDLAGGASNSPVEGTLRLRVRGGAEERLQEAPLQAPGRLEMNLDSTLSWEAKFEAKGFWSETLTVPSGSAGAEIRMRVFPAGSIRGRIVVPAGEKPLGLLVLRLQPPYGPGRQKPPEMSISCPVTEARMECEAPAGRYDIRLRAEGPYAPVYRWDFAIPAGKAADLGEIGLLRGASVAGWVETAEGAPPSHECRLKLSPSGAEPLDRRTADRLEISSFEARPNEKGFFQIVGVPPGQYEVLATQPGFAPTRVGPVLVRPDLESQVVERVVLARPVVVEIVLDPPLEPYGQPWAIELVRTDAQGGILESFRGKASEEGVWRSPAIPAGSYEIRILGDRRALWHRQTLEAQAGQPPLPIEIPVLRVKGTIEIGEEPLSTAFNLKGQDGTIVHFASDADGRFSGVLTKEGLWLLEIQSEDFQATLDPVDVRLMPGKSVAEVRIVVPDNKVAGQVVDEMGRPVPAASVSVRRTEKRNRPSRLTANEKGEFSARGLLPGPALLQAMEDDEERQSDMVAVTIPEEGEAPWQRLVLRKLRVVQGRVAGPAGGVAGALVFLWPAVGQLGASNLVQSVTGPDGSFEARLPADATLLNALIMPPGHALRLTSLLTGPDQPLDIPVELRGGTLVLERGDVASPLLVRGGSFTILKLLETWARLQGVRSGGDAQPLHLPNVEAGPYSLCAGALALSRLREGGEPPPANCASGVLPPNGELVLKPPAVKPAQ